MAKIGNLFVELKMNAAKYVSGMDKARQKTKSGAAGISSSLKKVGVAFAAMGAAAALGLGRMVQSTIAAGDKLAKLSETTGIAVETLSGLEFAAKQSGLDIDLLAKRMVNLQRRAQEGNRGVLSYKRAFDELGIVLTDGEGKLRGTEDLLLDIADSFANLEDGTKKAALATDIFSNKGVQLIPFLNQGRKGIEALKNEAAELGAVMSTETALAAQALTDNMGRLSTAVKGIGIQITTGMLPGLLALTDAFADSAKEGRSFVKIGEFIADAFVVIINAMKLGLLVFRVVKNDLLALGRVFFDLAKGVSFPETARRFFEEMEESARIASEGLAGLILPFEELEAKVGAGIRRLGTITGESTKAQVSAIQKIINALRAQADTLGLSTVALALHRAEAANATPDQLELVRALAATVGMLGQQGESVDSIIEKLQRQGETFGFSAAQMDVWTASALNADPAQIAAIKSLNDWLETMRQQKDVIQPMINALRKQNETFGMSTVELAVHRAEIAGATDDQIEMIRILAETGEAMREQAKIAAQTANIVRGGFSSLFDDLIRGGKRMGDIIKEMTLRLTSLIAKLALAKALGFIFPGNSIVADLIKGFSHGGRPQVGELSFVGERGPEIFMPSVPGEIIPNDRISSALRGPGAERGVSITYNVDARGGVPGIEHKIVQALQETKDLAVREAVSIVRNSRLRSP